MQTTMRYEFISAGIVTLEVPKITSYTVGGNGGWYNQ